MDWTNSLIGVHLANFILSNSYSFNLYPLQTAPHFKTNEIAHVNFDKHKLSWKKSFNQSCFMIIFVTLSQIWEEMANRQNNQLPNNLPQLQNLIKRDAESYKDEFL